MDIQQKIKYTDKIHNYLKENYSGTIPEMIGLNNQPSKNSYQEKSLLELQSLLINFDFVRITQNQDDVFPVLELTSYAKLINNAEQLLLVGSPDKYGVVSRITPPTKYELTGKRPYLEIGSLGKADKPDWVINHSELTKRKAALAPPKKSWFKMFMSTYTVVKWIVLLVVGILGVIATIGAIIDSNGLAELWHRFFG